MGASNAALHSITRYLCVLYLYTFSQKLPSFLCNVSNWAKKFALCMQSKSFDVEKSPNCHLIGCTNRDSYEIRIIYEPDLLQLNIDFTIDQLASIIHRCIYLLFVDLHLPVTIHLHYTQIRSPAVSESAMNFQDKSIFMCKGKYFQKLMIKPLNSFQLNMTVTACLLVYTFSISTLTFYLIFHQIKCSK